MNTIGDDRVVVNMHTRLFFHSDFTSRNVPVTREKRCMAKTRTSCHLARARYMASSRVWVVSQLYSQNMIPARLLAIT